jgi:aminopeptidase
MPKNMDTLLEKYADLAINVGLNLQKGQDLLILAPVTTTEFVRKAVSKAYDAGAKNVTVEYSDEQLSHMKYAKGSKEAMGNFPEWKAKGLVEMAKQNTAVLSIDAVNPTLLNDVDPELVAIDRKDRALKMREFNSYISTGKINWTIMSIPTKEWALKIFPGETPEKAVEKLWDQMFTVTRIYEENPVQKWKDHISKLNEKHTYLNEKRYKTLHYQGPGTDLTIELPEDHEWICAEFTNSKGIKFVPNIPTEEVFTSPHKDRVNGTVSSTKPLNYGGTLIENFSLTFKDGKVVDFKAESGYEALKNMLSVDEGAKYLGEVALVPHDSPISNSNVIFYNTLYDENASCHLAVGRCLPVALKGGKDMTTEELTAKGLNESATHVDFMIGSAELNIDGVKFDGTKEPIFRNGNWAF